MQWVTKVNSIIFRSELFHKILCSSRKVFFILAIEDFLLHVHAPKGKPAYQHFQPCTQKLKSSFLVQVGETDFHKAKKCIVATSTNRLSCKLEWTIRIISGQSISYKKDMIKKDRTLGKKIEIVYKKRRIHQKKKNSTK